MNFSLEKVSYDDIPYMMMYHIMMEHRTRISSAIALSHFTLSFLSY